MFRDMTRRALRSSGVESGELHGVRVLLHRFVPTAPFPGWCTRSAPVFETALQERPAATAAAVKHLPRAVRTVEQKLRDSLRRPLARRPTCARCSTKPSRQAKAGCATPDSPERAALEQEFDWFREALGDFNFAVTQPYW